MAREKNLDYDVRLPEWNQADPWFEFSEQMRKGTLLGSKLPWRAAVTDKGEAVHVRASTCDSLLNVYPNAIEVGAPVGTSEMTFMMPFFFLVALASAAAIGSIAFLFLTDMIRLGEWNVLSSVMSTTFIFFSLLFLLAALLFFRLAFLTPKDAPVLFNRKTHEVSFFLMTPMRFWKFWTTPKVGEVRTYRWDDVMARSYKMTEFTGSAGRESYMLALLWGEPHNPRQCKEIVTIGYKGWWEDALLWRLYEHIRRYMEEDGPPIQPGEFFRTSGTGKLPQFPSEIIAAAGGPALSAQEVQRLAGEVTA